MQLHHFLALSFSLTKVASPAPALPNDISGARAFRTQKFHSPAVKINDLIQCRLAETGDREELLDIQQWQHNFQGDPPSHAIKTVRQLGSGLSGEVFQVLLDGGTYALKAPWQTWTTEMFTKEYWLMHYYQTHLSKQDRSNLIELRAGVWVDITMQHELEFIVMEYADQGTLEDLLLKRPSLSTTVRIDLITGLVSAIRNLHKIGVAHRDLKPDNVLIQSTDGGQLVLKVADFGSARLLDPNFSDRFARFYQYDIYAVGILVQQIALGIDVYEGWEKIDMLPEQQMRGDDGRSYYLSDDMLGMIARMMNAAGIRKLPGLDEIQRLRTTENVYQNNVASKTIEGLIAG